MRLCQVWGGHAVSNVIFLVVYVTAAADMIEYIVFFKQIPVGFTSSSLAYGEYWTGQNSWYLREDAAEILIFLFSFFSYKTAIVYVPYAWEKC
jgi:hypothetical protein